MVLTDSPDTVKQTAVTDGQLRGRSDGVRVGVFMPAIEYYASLPNPQSVLRTC